MSLVGVRQEASIAYLEIQRPEALNALNREVLLALQEAILKLESVKVVCLTGSGDKAFVAGADIKAMQKMRPREARAFAALGQGIFRLLQDAPFLSVAGVNGFALGGGLELALACDLIYATPKSKFALPEINLGLVPGFGGTSTLLQRVGFHYAMEMICGGEMISAEEAYRRGLVLDLLSETDWKQDLDQKLRVFAEKGPESLFLARSLVRAHSQTDRDRAQQLERESFGTLFDTGEPQEGMTAFLEKRKPKF
ncbi:MAG: crotonase [Bradymonadales bacterium]|nr:MAG: crotonase [Bradymonadales bacterium]